MFLECTEICLTVFRIKPSTQLCLDSLNYGCQVDKIEESIAHINAGAKPLAAYLFTKDKKLQQDFVSNVSAGGMLVNDVALHVTAHELCESVPEPKTCTPS